jgi:hypothetical protein
MSEIKKSDQWMGAFGILFSFLVIGHSIIMVSVLIDVQGQFNDLAEDTCADSLFGCTAEEEEEIEEFMDSIQSKVVIWQTLWSLVVFSGFYLAYASLRLSMGLNWFRGLIFPEGHPMHVDDRRYFIFTLIGVILLTFSVGFGEIAIENGFYDDIDELADDGSKIERDTNTIFESNGGISGSCTSVFLFLILIIAFFTKGPAKTDEIPFTEATQSDGGPETSIDDLLGTTDTTEEQTDED